jgi:DNA (cytosine-5)-methyltransferase 1
LENVKGLTYKGHIDALEFLINRASRLGYCCDWRVINAADYGVPQLRERCFVVGVLDGEFSFPSPTHAKAPKKGQRKWVTAGAALNDLDTEEAANEYGHAAGGRFRHLLDQIPPGENYLFLTAERGHPNPQFIYRSRYWSYLLKLSPDLPSWTIQAKRSNNMGPLHWRNRVLRIEEVKRLQTIPDEFVLVGDVNSRWRQVGNAVPPLLARQLGQAIRAALRRCARQTKAA